ncbi:hypothetical protein EV177_010275, partial [Coemansia sp. RSA 1804]
SWLAATNARWPTLFLPARAPAETMAAAAASATTTTKAALAAVSCFRLGPTEPWSTGTCSPARSCRGFAPVLVELDDCLWRQLRHPALHPRDALWWLATGSRCGIWAPSPGSSRGRATRRPSTRFCGRPTRRRWFRLRRTIVTCRSGTPQPQLRQRSRHPKQHPPLLLPLPLHRRRVRVRCLLPTARLSTWMFRRQGRCLR